MPSRRTRLSLAQILSALPHPDLRILFEKHGLQFDELPTPLDNLAAELGGADEGACLAIVEEVCQTHGVLREKITPHYQWDQRFADLDRCLQLDGYRVALDAPYAYRLQAIEPVIEGTLAAEDALTQELDASGLADVPGVKALLNQSGESFRRVLPDYNACLASARTALETLARGIAEHRAAGVAPLPFDRTCGAVLSYLRTSGLITQDEEVGLAGVFRFDSPGAHVYVGITEEEAARLGRNLAVSMCYFLVKKHNG